MERLATAWVRRHDRKDENVGVGWDGCTQFTEIKGVQRYETESYNRATTEEKKEAQKTKKEDGTGST